MPEKATTTTQAFERAAEDRAGTEFVLHLFVAGTNPRSLRAVERVSRLCEEHLAGHYRLQVIDIYQHPALAEAGEVIATPTLVRTLPAPLRRLIGDLSDDGRVLMALGVKEAP